MWEPNRSEPNSGKLSLMNTESTPPKPTTETPTCNWKESTFITTKPQEEDTSLEPSWWIWSPEPWNPSEPDPSDNCSDPTTSFSDKLVPETTGPKVTTPKEPNWSTPSWTSSEKKPKDATASKDSKSPTPWEENRIRNGNPLDLQSQRRIPWQNHGDLLRCPFPKVSDTVVELPCLSTTWSRTAMNAWLLITRPCTISALEPWNWPPPPMVAWTTWSLLHVRSYLLP